MNKSVLVKVGAFLLVAGSAFAVPAYAADPTPHGHDHGASAPSDMKAPSDKKSGMDHCKRCAASCRRCAEACRAMAG